MKLFMIAFVQQLLEDKKEKKKQKIKYKMADYIEA